MSRAEVDLAIASGEGDDAAAPVRRERADAVLSALPREGRVDRSVAADRDPRLAVPAVAADAHGPGSERQLAAAS